MLAGDHPYAEVVATRDHHVDPGDHFSADPDFVDSWPPHCVVGTGGDGFSERLSFTDFGAIFDKGEYAAAYSGFEGRTRTAISLANWLRSRDVDAVDVCGLATDYCVRATALDSAAAGFATTVLLELAAAVAPDRLGSTLADFADAGVTVRGSAR